MKAMVTIYDNFGREFTQAESIEFPFSALSINENRRYAIDALEAMMIEVTQNAISKAQLEPEPTRPDIASVRAAILNSDLKPAADLEL